MRFSIIVPVYNVELYLDECVNSILSQSFSDFEVVLVDDGSRDNSGIMCDKFAQKDNRIKVIHQENKGLSGARNTGLNYAAGEYILFIDSDDFWIDSTFLERLDKYICDQKSDVVCFNYRKMYGDSFSPLYFQVNQDGDFNFVIKNDIWTACAWNKAVKRELFLNNELRFIEGITSEDIDWCARLAKLTSSISFLNVCALIYRQREGSITHSTNYKSVICLLNNVKNAEKITQTCVGLTREMLNQYMSYQVAILFYNISKLSNKKEKNHFFEELKKLSPYLKYSVNKKSKWMYFAYKFLRVRGTLLLLKVCFSMRGVLFCNQ